MVRYNYSRGSGFFLQLGISQTVGNSSSVDLLSFSWQDWHGVTMKLAELDCDLPRGGGRPDYRTRREGGRRHRAQTVFVLYVPLRLPQHTADPVIYQIPDPQTCSSLADAASIVHALNLITTTRKEILHANWCGCNWLLTCGVPSAEPPDASPSPCGIEGSLVIEEEDRQQQQPRAWALSSEIGRQEYRSSARKYHRHAIRNYNRDDGEKVDSGNCCCDNQRSDDCRRGSGDLAPRTRAARSPARDWRVIVFCVWFLVCCGWL